MLCCVGVGADSSREAEGERLVGAALAFRSVGNPRIKPVEFIQDRVAHEMPAQYRCRNASTARSQHCRAL
jgi:hypothetical protein